MENGRQKGPALEYCGLPFATLGCPKTFQKRIREATSIFHWFVMDFGTHFDDILMIWATFFIFFYR